MLRPLCLNATLSTIMSKKGLQQQHMGRFGGAPLSGNPSVSSNANTNRRKLGTRIKQGVADIRRLDAAPPTHQVRKRERDSGNSDNSSKNRRTEASATEHSESVATAVEAGAARVLPLDTPSSVFSKDWSDWSAVKQQLFSTHTNSEDVFKGVQSALVTIRTWARRSRHGAGLGAVPPYVEATAALAEAQQLDRSTSSSFGASPSPADCVVDSSALRASYAHAISRAVHFMTGSLIKSRSFVNENTTYRQRAQSSGFPEEAVEVRQRIAHGAEPTLAELRWVAAMTLQHLFHTYWVAQAAQVQDLNHQQRQKHNAAAQDEERRNRKAAKAARKSVSMDEMERLLAAADAAGDNDTAEGDNKDATAAVFFGCCTIVH